MSLYALPHLIVSLGTEMLYVLDQRLHAQEVNTEKRSRVLNDVISSLTAARFVGKLLRPGTLYSASVVSDIFLRLSKCTIMRLSKASYEKLYDLMTMGVKYQLLYAQYPADILHILANHLDAIDTLATGTSASLAVLSILDSMKTHTHADLQSIRHDLLNFFHTNHVKISMFLADGSQSVSGAFNLPIGGPIAADGITRRPGTIRVYSDDDPITPSSTSTFEYPLQAYITATRQPCSYTDKLRDCTLGTNMYYHDRKQLGPRAVYVNAQSGEPLVEGSGLCRDFGGDDVGGIKAAAAAAAPKEETAATAPDAPPPAPAAVPPEEARDELDDVVGMGDAAARRGSTGSAKRRSTADADALSAAPQAPVPSSETAPVSGINAPPPIPPPSSRAAPKVGAVRPTAADWSGNSSVAEMATLADMIRPPTSTSQQNARHFISVELFPGGRPGTAVRRANADGMAPGGGSPLANGAKSSAIPDDADAALDQGEVVITRTDRHEALKGVMADFADDKASPAESVEYVCLWPSSPSPHAVFREPSLLDMLDSM